MHVFFNGVLPTEIIDVFCLSFHSHAYNYSCRYSFCFQQKNNTCHEIKSLSYNGPITWNFIVGILTTSFLITQYVL